MAYEVCLLADESVLSEQGLDHLRVETAGAAVRLSSTIARACASAASISVVE